MTAHLHLRTMLAGLALLLACLLQVAPGSAAEAYRLSVADSVRVRVVEWQPAESVLQEWAALGGDYVVGPDGTISFPFVGETESAGRTTAELASKLGAGLQQALGLMSPPDVSVEVAKFGPVYVTGEVQSPGQYPYAPGLDVIKVVALAGGERHAADPGARTDRDLITVKGTLELLRSQYQRLVARRARIDAELASAATVPVPSELSDAQGGPQLVAVEEAMLQAHDRQVKSSLEAIAGQKQLLTRQLDALAQKRRSAETQLALAQEQLDNVQSLKDQGLANSSRVAQLQSSVADISSRLLDIDTAALTARQGLGNADREGNEIEGRRVADLTALRQQTEADMTDLALRIATQEALLREAARYGAELADTADLAPVYSYTISRGGEEIAAGRADAVRPGDVLIVGLSF